MLDRLFSPRAIAIVGASPEPRRPGGHPLVALKEYGYAGGIFPVNPRHAEINGMRCYAHVRELPGPCDLALVAVPAAEVPGVIEDCGAAGIGHAIVFSAGFSEIGETGAGLQARLEAAIRASGVRVVGPNCIGILNLPQRLFAGFGSGFRNPHWRGGPVAMISQSGGFAYSITAFCQEQGVGMDCMVSTGNEADLTALDFIEYFLEQDGVRLVAVYLEGLKDGRRLRALGRRALETGKPIAVWKVGNTETGRKAAVSH
ncbi:MAG: CoA-binding protein, partial [Burkholderiales bacterium]|nr:CoA-binding protein [Burkholderiales bacterium]